MEGDVVLAQEVQMPWTVAVLIKAPPRSPRLFAQLMFVGVAFCPNLGARQVTLDGFKPDINALSVPVFVRKGNRNSPFEITRDGPWTQAHVQPLLRHGSDIGFPLFGRAGSEGFQGTLKDIKPVKQVFRFPDLNLAFRVHLRTRVGQFDGFVRGPTGVALVSAGIVCATRRTGALHIPVREEAAAILVNLKELRRRAPFKQSCFVQTQDIGLNTVSMGGVAGPIEEGSSIFHPPTVDVLKPRAP